jgi:putative phosphoesterase
VRGLLISDIHANPWALRAVEAAAGPVDFMLCAGDWVNYGPDPAAAVVWALERRVKSVLGNHDHAVACGSDPRAASAKLPLALAMRDWSRRQLTDRLANYLIGLPRVRTARFGGAAFEVLHATPIDPLYDYCLTPKVSDAEFRRIVDGVDVDVLVVGHTHLPFVRRRESLCVVNPGSVGQPLDGDPRASYAVWHDGAIELHRVEYDQRPVLDAIEQLPCLANGQCRTLQETLVRARTR